MTRTELPQKMAALVLRNVDPCWCSARLVGEPTTKGRVQPVLLIDIDGGTPLKVKGRSGEALRKWFRGIVPQVAVQ